MAECPVCYRHVTPDEEAYAYPCFHRFCLDCISGWTDAQAAHPVKDGGHGASALPTCPCCRQPYTHIIYDAVGITFRWD